MATSYDYQYSKITRPGTIRVLQPLPSGAFLAPLKCSLISADISNYENSLLDYYIALSYVWGDANLKSTISVDGKRLVITASLDTALRHIRDEKKTLPIWADGICINQQDVLDILNCSAYHNIPGNINSPLPRCVGEHEAKYDPIDGAPELHPGVLLKRDSGQGHSRSSVVLENLDFPRIDTLPGSLGANWENSNQVALFQPLYFIYTEP